MSPDVRIGISGWTYKPWRGAFYPLGLPQKKELAHASSVFRSIEINGTYYGLQRPEIFARWAAQTPDDVVFAVKGSRVITHMKRLTDPEAPLARFMVRGGELRAGSLGRSCGNFRRRSVSIQSNWKPSSSCCRVPSATRSRSAMRASAILHSWR